MLVKNRFSVLVIRASNRQDHLDIRRCAEFVRASDDRHLRCLDLSIVCNTNRRDKVVVTREQICSRGVAARLFVSAMMHDIGDLLLVDSIQGVT